MTAPLVERLERWAVHRLQRPYGALGRDERVVLAAAAVGVLAIAPRTRWPRTIGAAAGVVLARSIAGWCPVTGALQVRHRSSAEALSGPRGEHIRASVAIARPAREVFEFWRSLSGFDAATEGRVRVAATAPRTSRWEIRTDADRRPLVRWEAVLIHEETERVIGWRTRADAAVVNAGSVRFVPTPQGGTLVRVHLQYAPPFGAAGAAAARLAGHAPLALVRRALADVKRHLEAGVK